MRQRVYFLDRNDKNPSDDVVFVAEPPNQRTAVYHIAGWQNPRASPESLQPSAVRQAGLAAEAVPLGEKLVISQVEYVDANRLFYDLFVVEDKGPPRRLTRGARLRDPAAHPDGKRIFAVRFTALGCSLVQVYVDSGKIETLFSFDRGTWVYTPAISPDGNFLAASVMVRGGSRQIIRFDIVTNEQGQLQRAKRKTSLTHQDMQHLDPAFTPDGKWLIYSSDQNGSFDLYAQHLATSVVVPITQTLGAATHPTVTPDGKAVVYIDLHKDGNDYFVTSLQLPDDDTLQERVFLKQFTQRPPPTVPPAASTNQAPLVDKAYNPFSTALPRRFLPVSQSDAVGGLELGAVVEGNDAADFFDYKLDAHFQTGLMRPYVNARGRWLYSPWPISGSLNWQTRYFGRETSEENESGYEQRQEITASVDVVAPFRFALFSHTFGAGLSRTWTFYETPLALHPQGPTLDLSGRGDLAALRLSWTYSDAKFFRDSAATETGQRFNVRLKFAHAWTLSDVEIAELSFDSRFFRPIPQLNGHSLMLQIAGAYAIGDRRQRANYRLGGFAARDLTLDVVNDSRFGLGYLRGYPSSVDIGDGYWLTTLEYRFPILDIEKGFELLPISFNRLVGALFVDAGDAFDGVPHARGVRIGVGAELRLLMTFGYYGRVWTRWGVAQGLLQRGIFQPYFLFGTPF
ncbi:MAG: BamA/TamA family outer membrane protein [Deltaproteobacteria bacterium]|nr:BamA/TamA family outer membrane protein [Deltaproteobacteria bacterium]